MKKYLFAHPFMFLAIVLLSILSQGTVTAVSFVLMFVIDSIASGDMSNLITSAYMGIGVVVLFFILILANTRLIVFYVYKTTLKIKNDLFSAILGTKISDFNKSNSAKHISLINNDIKVVADKYINGIIETVKFITTILFALVAMAFLSPVNALVALVLSSSPLILPVIFGKKLARTNMVYMEKLAALNEKVKDFLLGFEIIKTFNIEKNIQNKFSQSAQEAENAHYHASRASVKLGALSGTFMVATDVLTYLIAGYFVIIGHITIGAVIAIAGLNSGIIGPMQYLSINLANIKSSREIRDRLLKTMTPVDSNVREADADFSSGIQIDNLSFAYTEQVTSKTSKKPKSVPRIKMIPTNGKSVEDILAELGIDPSTATILDGSNMNPNTLSSMLDSPEKIMGSLPMQGVSLQDDEPHLEGAVLKNLSYSFRPGGKYAIVGGSGSGKSTLLRVIMGYYDDYVGHVRINGHEIRDINRESLYKSLSMMHQNVFILDDTLYNNITLYNSYSDVIYNQTVSKAKLSELIESLGSSANVGEGGNALSGGERQRVAIARALIKGSQVLMMDEATSNLDNETAYEIEKALVEMPSLTSIFVTHRYTKELLVKCDGILVMRDGELTETGTFDELYNKKGYFYSLYMIGGK